MNSQPKSQLNPCQQQIDKYLECIKQPCIKKDKQKCKPEFDSYYVCLNKYLVII